MTWQKALLTEDTLVNPHFKKLRFTVKNWTPHIPGQYYSVCVVSSDGYSAERDYSISSAPEEEGIVELGVELLPDGEVSPFLHKLKIGDQIQVKGPRGDHFVWDIENRPMILFSAGSGIVPFMSMVRHAHTVNSQRPMLLFASFKTKAQVLYRQELQKITHAHKNLQVVFVLTKDSGRIDRAFLKSNLAGLINTDTLIYISGGSSFVESIRALLLSMKVDQSQIKFERFG